MIRFVRSHWGYLSLATTVLSLAVGVNMLVLSIVNALWLRPVPVVEPERVVTILQSRSTVASLDSPFLKVFDGPVAGQVVTTGFNEAFRPRIFFPQIGEPLEALGVSPRYFEVLGVPVRGRGFTPADELDGAEAVAILSDRLWNRAFGRRPDVIGAIVNATPRPLRIIGVAASGFEGARRGDRADLWVPVKVVRDLAPSARQIDRPTMMVFARLGPGQRMSELEQRYRELRTPPDGSQPAAEIAPTFARLTDVFGTSDSPSILIREGRTLAVVSGLALLVLGGGCATIASLALTHYERRRPELAVKASLGASPARLARELAGEASVLWLAGSSGAIVCGLLGARMLPALSLPGGINIGRLDLSADWRLCVLALCGTALTLAVASIGAVWSVMNGRLAGKMSAGSITVTAAAVRVRRRPLALQVCATTVVLVASGLFVRTVLYSFRVASGIDVDRTVFVSVQEKPLEGLETSFASGVDPLAAGLARRAQLADVLLRLPSVRDVAGGTPPIGTAALTASTPLPHTFNIAGREVPALVGVMWGTPNLLSVLGVPLLAGRALDARDASTINPISAVITRSLAQRLWPTRDALGQVLVSASGYPRRSLIVGIAEDFAFGTLSRPIDGVLVIARGDSDFRVSNMVLQTDDPRGVAAAVPALLPGRVVRVTTGREVIARDIAQQRLGAWAFSGFGLVALVLGIGGVFGLVAYLTHARQREFGIRMVLGATLPRLLQTAVTAALWPAVIGMIAGMLIGAAVSRVFAALLVGINGLDLWTYGSIGLMVLVPALLAALAAAWRLRRLTPAAALRCS
jgi:predicted permease